MALAYFFYRLVYNYAKKIFLKALKDLQKQLQKMVNKNPKSRWVGGYARVLKALALMMALFSGPEAFALASGILWHAPHPVFRYVWRFIRFGFRWALVISTFFYGSTFFIEVYKEQFSTLFGAVRFYALRAKCTWV